MKEEIKNEDQREWKYHGYIFTGLMFVMVVSALPLFRYLDKWGGLSGH